MRLLHVSDWHLGRSLGRVARRPDHEAVLQEILGIAREAHPDLIVHTGDLFDRARPSVEDLELVASTLRELATTAPIVVLAGNHDSAAFFDVIDQIFALTAPPGVQRVRFLGRARHPDDGGVLEYATEREVVRLAPLPFVHPNTLLKLFEVEPERWAVDYSEQVGAVERLLGRALSAGYRQDRDVLLFAAHLHIAGAWFSNSERPLHVSDSYASTTESLPAVSYAAFGHIHRPQALPGTTLGRYAGSPIQIDFGELGEEKSVVLVDAKPGQAASVDVIPLTSGRPLRFVEGTLEVVAALNDVDGCIVKAVIDTEEPMPDLSERLARLWPNAHLFDVVDRSPTAIGPVTAVDPDEVEPPTVDLFREYLGTTGLAASRVDGMIGLFERLHASVDDDEGSGDLFERRFFEFEEDLDEVRAEER